MKLLKEISNLPKDVNTASFKIDGVDRRDHPDYADAYISYAEYMDGSPVPDALLDKLTDTYGDIVNQMACARMFEDGTVMESWKTWSPYVHKNSASFNKGLTEAILSYVKEKYSGKAWFKGGSYSYLIDASQPKLMIASDGAEVKVNNIAEGLSEYADRGVLKEFAECDQEHWNEYFRPSRQSVKTESVKEDSTNKPNVDQILEYLTGAYRSLQRYSDSYQDFSIITRIYDGLRHDLKAGDYVGFSRAYEEYLSKYPDAAGELYDAMFEEAGLPHDGTIEQFLKKCSINESADGEYPNDELGRAQAYFQRNANADMDFADIVEMMLDAGFSEEIARDMALDAGRVEEGVVDTIKRGIKNVKRGIVQGWDKNAVGPNGEKLGEPRAVLNRVKARTDDEIKSLSSTLTNPKHRFVTRNTSFDNPVKHSPADLQKRQVDREMKKRGLGEGIFDRFKRKPEQPDDPQMMRAFHAAGGYDHDIDVMAWQIGWKTCASDPSADPKQVFQKMYYGGGSSFPFDQKSFMMAFNACAKRIKRGLGEAVKTDERIEAHGIRGMDRRPWQKIFKNVAALEAWCEKFDAEVYGTRDVDAGKQGRLSPAMRESSDMATYHHSQANRLHAELGVNGHDSRIADRLEKHKSEYTKLTGKKVDFSRTNKKWGLRPGLGESAERYHFLYPHVPLNQHSDHEYNKLSDRDLKAMRAHQAELASKLRKPGAAELASIAKSILINREREIFDGNEKAKRAQLDARYAREKAAKAKKD